MGSNAVISVLGFIIIFTFATTTINKRNSQSYENTYGYVKYVTSRDIARNAIQVTLRKIDTLTVLSSSSFPVTGSLNGGTFAVNGEIINDSTVRLTSQSTFETTTYTIKTLMHRMHLNFEPSKLKAALGVHPTPLGSFSMQGDKDTIDGRDHDLNGNLLLGSPDTVAGVAVMKKADSTTVYNGAQYPTTNILGSPPIKVDSTIPNADSIGPKYKTIADYYFTNGKKKSDSVITSAAFGSASQPVIVYCDGGSTANGFKFNSCVGWGILVVRGSLTFAGNTTWHGLIIEFGNAALTFDGSTGNAQLFGGLLIGGLPGTSYKLGGGARIFHSGSALSMAQNISTPFNYTFLDWYEKSSPPPN
ncbi:MAG: hypothetical protein HY033_12455 [Ignavibacteriae bacterium]|nr:hypothetical protein [Ignavibacteria bacterium]MBI3365704.1 hypothetical protein [Ignavibacteriota bacterium]